VNITTPAIAGAKKGQPALRELEYATRAGWQSRRLMWRPHDRSRSHSATVPSWSKRIAADQSCQSGGKATMTPHYVKLPLSGRTTRTRSPISVIGDVLLVE
jgi:hypothetical protein